MAGTNRSTSGDVVLDIINLISIPPFKRDVHDIDLALPWLRKRSKLLQNQEPGVLQDIVKNCSLLTVGRDEVIIKQGDRGDCFYVVLRGSVSVYIDPKMTGEGTDDTISRTSGTRKKKSKRKTKPSESEESILSGMEKGTSETSGEKGEQEGSEVPESERGGEHEEEEEEEEEGTVMRARRPHKPLAPLDRNKFGRMIVTYGTGKAFGEVALVHRDLNRNASVIADEDTDVMVIDQELFDRSLRAEQEARYEEIRVFIDEHPFFNQMTTKHKKLLEMSIRKEHYIFDTNIIRQGDPVLGLHFILRYQPEYVYFSGGANISIQPKKHQLQYPHLWPFEAGVDQLSIEFEHLREARKAAIMRKYEDPAVWETKPEELIIRREQGYAAIEKKMKENHISLCSVQTKEVLGDVEMLVGLGTYMQTVRCTSNTECFILDTKNFDRLVGKKNNPQTTQVMREYVKAKLHTRMNMRNADLIPFLGYLHQKLTEQSVPPQKKVEPFKMSKALPDADEEMQHLLQYFREGKEVVLIKPSVPGVVYYREMMREKAKNRESQRRTSKASEGGIKLGSVYKNQKRRQPRSMLQIRESLRQMMEAEVIEMENKKKLRKKAKARGTDSVDAPPSFRSVPNNTPRTLVSDTNRPLTDDEKAMRNAKPNLLTMMKNAQKQDSDTPRDTAEASDPVKAVIAHRHLKSTKNLPKATPPVLVTELSKSQQELPVIREENSQDEINVNGDSKGKSEVNSKSKLSSRPVSKTPTNRMVETPTSSRPVSKTPTNKMVETPKSERKHESATSFKDDTCADNVNTKAKPDKLATPHKRKRTPRTPSKSPIDQKSTALPPIKVTNYDDKNEQPELNCMHQDTVPKLPEIAAISQVEKPATAETDDTVSTGSWDKAMSFVNQRIQARLSQAMHGEDSPYNDYETSEPSLKLLENRIKAFHVKYGMGNRTKNLPHLKRYKLDDELSRAEKPKPGGKVWVKKQMCKFTNTEYVVKDHKHVRYQMVESIPEFDKVQKSKVVMQQLLQSTDFGENDMF